MKTIRMSFIALFFSLGCMAYSKEQAKALVIDFYDKLNFIANEQYSLLKTNEELNESLVSAQENFQQLAWSLRVDMPNDFLFLEYKDEYERIPSFSVYSIHLREMVKHLYKLKLPFKSPYQIKIFSVDSLVGVREKAEQDKDVFYTIKLNKKIALGEKTISFDEEITILAPSYKIVKISNKATDPDMVMIDVDENEEEEQQTRVRQLINRVKENFTQLNNSTLNDEKKNDCIEQLKESFLCNKNDGNFKTNVLVGKSDKMISMNNYLSSFPRERKQQIISIDTYNPYKYSKDIDGSYIVWAHVYTFIYRPDSEIGYEVRRGSKDIRYNTIQKPYKKLSLPDGSSIKSIQYLLGDITIAEK